MASLKRCFSSCDRSRLVACVRPELVFQHPCSVTCRNTQALLTLLDHGLLLTPELHPELDPPVFAQLDAETRACAARDATYYAITSILHTFVSPLPHELSYHVMEAIVVRCGAEPEQLLAVGRDPAALTGEVAGVLQVRLGNELSRRIHTPNTFCHVHHRGTCIFVRLYANPGISAPHSY